MDRLFSERKSNGWTELGVGQQALGINSGDVAVGVDLGRGFVFSSKLGNIQMKDLDSGGDHGPSIATAINDHGTVVGEAAIRPSTDESANDAPVHAVLWKHAPSGDEIDLGSLPGYRDSIAMAINDHDDVVGYSSKPANGDDRCRGCLADETPLDGVMILPPNGLAMLWKSGSRFSLDVLPGAKSGAALGINDEDVVVGTSGGRAVLWRNGNIKDLNASISPRSGWLLSRAQGVNNSGWIVGVGMLHGVRHGFALVPKSQDRRE
jgi:uncharacterized membrane protein